MDIFLKNKLHNYASDRNDPSKEATSVNFRNCIIYFILIYINQKKNLSPYLHFGMISPVYIYCETMKLCKQSESRDSFLEELIVRRELSMNFCFYNKNYDNYNNLPNWAKETL